MGKARLGGEFLRFAIVGAVGFVVDALVVYLLAGLLNLNPYATRVGSYLCAATTTWALNRTYTFKVQESGRSLLGEWAHFLLANLGGGAVNYLTFAALVARFGNADGVLVLAVAAGSIAGLGVNFAVTKWWVFAHRGAAQGSGQA